MKIFEGIVVSTSMQNTAVVKVTRSVTHKLYKKVLKRSKKYKVDTEGIKVSVGDSVKIIETRPISKDKHFILQSKMSDRNAMVKEKEKKRNDST